MNNTTTYKDERILEIYIPKIIKNL